jgi:hypothetical protein
VHIQMARFRELLRLALLLRFISHTHIGPSRLF